MKRKRSEADFAEEIKAHLELEADDLKCEGLSDAEARRNARVEFGSQSVARERFNLRGRLAWWDDLSRDLRYGRRGLLKNPGFTAAAVITLALAIGANTTIFSLLDQALMRALPVTDPGRLVVLSFAGSQSGHVHGEGGSTPDHKHEFSYPMFRDLRERNTSLSGLIASATSEIGISWQNRPENVQAEMVTGNYFEVLGVRPAMGRVLVASDETAEGQNPLAVLSFDYWKTHLAEAQVVGQTMLLNGTQFTVVGVAAPGFHSMIWGRTPAIYVPMTMQRVIEPEWQYLKDHHSFWINLTGRLRPGVTRERAEAEMNALFLALRAEEFKDAHDQSDAARKKFIDGSHLNLDAGATGFSPMRDQVRMPLTIVMGMALLVVGMAIVNVAGLLLVRAATRAREFSVRYALGATKAQIVRQLLAEGLLLGAVGAVLGLAVAPRVLNVLIHWMSGKSGDPSAFTATIDWRVMGLTIAVTLAASLLFSLAPAAQFWNPRLVDALKQQMGTGVGGSLKFRRTCVALQIGFGLLLIVAAGLFVKTIANLKSVDPGFATDRLLSFELAPEMAGYVPARVAPVEQQALDAIATLPGVRSVGATNDPDLSGDGRGGDVAVAGYTPKPDENFDVELPWVSDGYLQTLGVPLVAGRMFNTHDTANSDHVAIVNESFVRHYFSSDTAALGRHVARPDRPATDATIVGVVRDVKHASVRELAGPTAYVLFSQAEKPTRLRFYVRTWAAPEAAANEIREAIARIDGKLVVGDLGTMSETIDQDLMVERTIALLAGVFGVLAAVLAGVGLYGILAYSTAQRTREIGIRMALGARRTTVVGLIVREVLLLAGGAMAATVPLAILGSYAVRSQLFGVSIADPAVYGAGISVILLVAAVAGLVPARRAASINPTVALRNE